MGAHLSKLWPYTGNWAKSSTLSQDSVHIVIRGMFENFYEFTSIRILVIVIHYCSTYVPVFYEIVLRSLWQFIHLTDSQGLGTDDHTLIRVIVSRCEVDMVQIKKKFYQKYHQSLGSFIKVGPREGSWLVVPASFPILHLYSHICHTRMQQINLKIETFGQCSLP